MSDHKGVIRYFEYCAACGLVWDATICASAYTACPLCAYSETSDELYDTERERDDYEMERDEAQIERDDMESERDELQSEVYTLEDDIRSLTNELDDLRAEHIQA